MSESTSSPDQDSASKAEDHIQRIQQLEAQLAAMTAESEIFNAQLYNAQHLALELAGLISEYQSMPCESLRITMFTALNHYAPRIAEHRSLYQHALASGNRVERMATQQTVRAMRHEVDEAVQLLSGALKVAMEHAEEQVHVCDKDNATIKSRRLPPEMKAIYDYLQEWAE